VIDGDNYRETIVAHGLSARARAVLDEVLDLVQDDRSRRILMLEAVTPFALALRGRYPYALGCEYLPKMEDRRRFFPIPHCDIQKTVFDDGSFDVVVSNDVLEHVPGLPDALQEMRRILRPQGACIATFPFAYNTYETSLRATIQEGEIIHLATPEYHGNPVDPQGSLVFQVPGWDVLDMCRVAGFAHAEKIFISSVPRGVTGAEVAGVFLLKAIA
jgi:SAM-dependent methyltransferase